MFPTETTTYTITASGPGGTATASVIVTVMGDQPAPTATIFASPQTIELGGEGDTSSILTWTTTGATSVNIDQGIGEVALNSNEGELVNNITVSPTQTTTYTITATSLGGTATASVTVSVMAPPLTAIISASHAAVITGESVELTWETTNAETVTINQGIGSVLKNGSVQVVPEGATTYTLTATGQGNSEQRFRIHDGIKPPDCERLQNVLFIPLPTRNSEEPFFYC